MTTTQRSERLEDLRAHLARERAAIEGAHRAGAGGATVVRLLRELMDRLIVDLARWEARAGAASSPSVTAAGAGEGGARGWALVALGGYGRQELFPWSDVDLMLLYEPAARGEAEELSRSLFRALWDLRLHLGHSTRTVADCLEVAGHDLATRTSLLEGRLLWGDAVLFQRFERRLADSMGKKRSRFVRDLVEALRRGYAKHGSSVYLLEPNVKKSGGGLRTIHFLRWIGLALHGTADLGVLHARGLLTAVEGRALREAQEFFWRVRNDLHFAAGHLSDTVSFEDQVRLARLFGYRDDGTRLGVERFMQRFYLHATDVHEIVGRFIARNVRKSRWRRARDRTLARRVEEIFVLLPDEIGVTSGGRERLLSDPGAIYTLFHLAQIHGREIQPELLDAVRSALEVLDEARLHAGAVVARFREVLSTPGRIADTLSLMHRTGALEKLLPEFAAVNRLVQFNRYHKYTVDEHTLMVVRRAEALAEPRAAEIRTEGGQGAPEGRAPTSSHLAKAYGEIRRKDILHLAMLLHDLGKARGGDHSATGAGIAAAVARRLGYEEHETRLLVLLVREHLMMEQVAFRRNLADEKVLLDFARAVASPEVLKMLFVLTYADIAGVGPGSWTAWKEELLTELYTRVMDELTGSRELAAPEERLAVLKRQLFERLRGRHPLAWLEAQWEVMNERYVLVTPVETIARHVEWLAELGPQDVLVRAENRPATGTTDYTVLTFDDIVPGLFSRIAGVLAAKGLQILGAQVDTRKNDVVVDTFDVVDTFYAGPPPPERLEEVSGAIREVLLGRVTVEELFARHRRFRSPRGAGQPAVEPTKVEVDNDSSDDFTVVEVFAPDRQGLLYAIARTLWDLGLSVHSSKVATRLDQVLDVFYVTERAGGRVVDPERIAAVRSTLVERIEAYGREEASRPAPAALPPDGASVPRPSEPQLGLHHAR